MPDIITVQYLTPREADERLRLGKAAIYALLKSAKAASVKTGRARRIPVPPLAALQEVAQ